MKVIATQSDITQIDEKLVADDISQKMEGTSLEIPMQPSSPCLERYGDDDPGFGDNWKGHLEDTTELVPDVINKETDHLHIDLAGNLHANLEMTTV